MEQGVDKARGHGDELRQFRLEQVVVMLVFSARELVILLDLSQGVSVYYPMPPTADTESQKEEGLTLKRFFSSLRLFSFFSLSLLSELLCRS